MPQPGYELFLGFARGAIVHSGPTTSEALPVQKIHCAQFFSRWIFFRVSPCPPPETGRGLLSPVHQPTTTKFANGAYEPGTRHCQAAEILSLGSFQRLDQNRIPDSPVFAKVAPFVARGVVVFCLD